MNKRTSKIALAAAAAVAIAVGTPRVSSHCQLPCGIYDDHARLAALAEHITTVEKSIKQIAVLSAADEKNYNQIVRWVTNKEVHCEQLTEIVTGYFMAQRIKPVSKGSSGYESYVDKLAVLHSMMFHAMKAKQTTDLEHVEQLRELLKRFHGMYHTH
jgi:nickel superoxide dismutase